MRYVMSRSEEAIKTPDDATRIGAKTRPLPGTWEDQVLTFAGCYALEERARRDMREETRQPTGRSSDRNVPRDHVAELLTVASAVETFLEGYLKANPGHSLATALCHALQARLREVEGEAG
jgi:hypothetical protein